jgi:hypothetical protein
MNEHSVTGRLDSAWSKHRYKEMRRPMDVLDNDGQGTIVHQDSTNLPDDVYNHPHGGIPLIYSLVILTSYHQL